MLLVFLVLLVYKLSVVLSSIVGLMHDFSQEDHRVKTIFKAVSKLFSRHFLCVVLQCFDAVGWVAGRASGL